MLAVPIPCSSKFLMTYVTNLDGPRVASRMWVLLGAYFFDCVMTTGFFFLFDCRRLIRGFHLANFFSFSKAVHDHLSFVAGTSRQPIEVYVCGHSLSDDSSLMLHIHSACSDVQNMIHFSMLRYINWVCVRPFYFRWLVTHVTYT